jgi:hypothetical protein
MNDDALDRLLSEPLGEVADSGFSARTVVRLERQAWWRERAALLLVLAGGGAIVPLPSLHELTEAVHRLSPMLASSSAVAAAAAALALTLSFERRLAESAL